jgi:hypothetical protein
VARVEPRAVYAGTELEMGCPVYDEEGKDELVIGMGSLSEAEGGGRAPPERKEGQSERSSGRDVPVDDEGDK